MPRAPATVLVVDDDLLVAELLQASLEMAGYAVRHAPDGAAALTAVQSDPPDLVLLDVMMPDVDGWTVLSQLREDRSTASLPVVLLTGKSMPADQLRAWNLGASGFLAKPFSSEELLGKVDQVLLDAQDEL